MASRTSRRASACAPQGKKTHVKQQRHHNRFGVRLQWHKNPNGGETTTLETHSNSSEHRTSHRTTSQHACMYTCECVCVCMCVCVTRGSAANRIPPSNTITSNATNKLLQLTSLVITSKPSLSTAHHIRAAPCRKASLSNRVPRGDADHADVGCDGGWGLDKLETRSPAECCSSIDLSLGLGWPTH